MTPTLAVLAYRIFSPAALTPTMLPLNAVLTTSHAPGDGCDGDDGDPQAIAPSDSHDGDDGDPQTAARGPAYVKVTLVTCAMGQKPAVTLVTFAMTHLLLVPFLPAQSASCLPFGLAPLSLFVKIRLRFVPFVAKLVGLPP